MCLCVRSGALSAAKNKMENVSFRAIWHQQQQQQQPPPPAAAARQQQQQTPAAAANASSSSSSSSRQQPPAAASSSSKRQQQQQPPAAAAASSSSSKAASSSQRQQQQPGSSSSSTNIFYLVGFLKPWFFTNITATKNQKISSMGLCAGSGALSAAKTKWKMLVSFTPIWYQQQQPPAAASSTNIFYLVGFLKPWFLTNITATKNWKISSMCLCVRSGALSAAKTKWNMLISFSAIWYQQQQQQQPPAAASSQAAAAAAASSSSRCQIALKLTFSILSWLQITPRTGNIEDQIT